MLYIKPNHEAALSPSLDPYLQVFHIGLQVLPAPLRCLLEDRLEACCRLSRQLLHIEQLHQLLGACIFLHCHSSQHDQVWRHALCNNQSVSQLVSQSVRALVIPFVVRSVSESETALGGHESNDGRRDHPRPAVFDNEGITNKRCPGL